MEKNMKKKVCLISFVGPKEGHEEEILVQNSLKEMEELLKVLNYSVDRVFIQKVKSFNNRILLGEGKLLEVQAYCKEHSIDTLIFDTELSPGQNVRIEKLLQMNVFDRTFIILQIFSDRAKDEFSKIQVQIALEEYLLPRLVGRWSHLSRQKGGIGLKGDGEKQIEIDRRISKNKIFLLKEKFKILEKRYLEQSKKRKENILTATLIGRTNAGKSSLMNALCKESQVVSHSYFSTLDTRFRALIPKSNPLLCICDTVGLIQKLPTQIVSGFRSTLLAIEESKVLIFLLDASDKNFDQHKELIQQHLSSEKKSLLVFNKIDLISSSELDEIQKTYPEAYFISTVSKEGISNLKDSIVDSLLLSWRK